MHERVHTKEKPHLCEKCGKVRHRDDPVQHKDSDVSANQPFSDSSSLARHRRIHSGTRPYQCPYADCQKTFTRRTTLTRHQNHHTGTVEEAAAARAAALATRAQAQVADPTKQEHPEGEEQSDASSNASQNTYMAPMPSRTPYQSQALAPDFQTGGANPAMHIRGAPPNVIPQTQVLAPQTQAGMGNDVYQSPGNNNGNGPWQAPQAQMQKHPSMMKAEQQPPVMQAGTGDAYAFQGQTPATYPAGPYY